MDRLGDLLRKPGSEALAHTIAASKDPASHGLLNDLTANQLATRNANGDTLLRVMVANRYPLAGLRYLKDIDPLAHNKAREPSLLTLAISADVTFNAQLITDYFADEQARTRYVSDSFPQIAANLNEQVANLEKINPVYPSRPRPLMSPHTPKELEFHSNVWNQLQNLEGLVPKGLKKLPPKLSAIETKQALDEAWQASAWGEALPLIKKADIATKLDYGICANTSKWTAKDVEAAWYMKAAKEGLEANLKDTKAKKNVNWSNVDGYIAQLTYGQKKNISSLMSVHDFRFIPLKTLLKLAPEEAERVIQISLYKDKDEVIEQILVHFDAEAQAIPGKPKQKVQLDPLVVLVKKVNRLLVAAGTDWNSATMDVYPALKLIQDKIKNYSEPSPSTAEKLKEIDKLSQIAEGNSVEAIKQRILVNDLVRSLPFNAETRVLLNTLKYPPSFLLELVQKGLWNDVRCYDKDNNNVLHYLSGALNWKDDYQKIVSHLCKVQSRNKDAFILAAGNHIPLNYFVKGS